MTPSPQDRDLPLYAKIADDLRDKITDGFYGPGALLPSRNEIAAMYGVSAITARDALAVLSQEGYARAIRGRGPHRPPQAAPPHRARPPLRRRHHRRHDPGPGAAGTAPTGCVPGDRAGQHRAAAGIAAPIWSGSAAPSTSQRADRQPIQIHVSWLPGLGDDAGASAAHPRPGHVLAGGGAAGHWPHIATVLQNTRARGANPFEADTFGIPDGHQCWSAT